MINFIFSIKKIKRKDIVIVFFILILPLLYYIHLLFPEDKEYSFLFFTFNSLYYDGIDTMVWVTMIKIISILTYSIWFVTCSHWWRYSILVPLVFSINQFVVAINSEIYYVDNYELTASAILSIPIILLLFFISKKLNYHNEAKDLIVDVDEEMQSIWNNLLNFNSDKFKIILEELRQLRVNKKEYTNEQYLTELQKLHDDLLNIIEQ